MPTAVEDVALSLRRTHPDKEERRRAALTSSTGPAWQGSATAACTPSPAGSVSCWP
jgi:hypothetical protein